MGNFCNVCNSTEITFKVGTLNYSGILNSPFQFYTNDNYQEQTKLSQIFDQYLINKKKLFKDTKSIKWEVGQIDKKMQKERYTPIYNKTAGVENNKLLTQSQFQHKWDQIFDKNLDKNMKYNETNRQQIRQFDLACYQTFIKFVYKQFRQDLEEKLDKKPQSYKSEDPTFINNNPNQISPRPYLQFLNKYFQKPYINQQAKIKKTVQAINQLQIDILFLQQTSKQFQKSLKKIQNQFYIKYAQKGESMIIVRKSFIQKIDQHYPSKQVQKQIELSQLKLNWNQDSVFVAFKQIILISAHLSSKKQKNPEQTKLLNDQINELAQRYPNYQIIIGIDANNPNVEVKSPYQIFPKEISAYTTCKKRTHIQLQAHKSDTLAKQKRDYIVANTKMQNQQIMTISQEIINPQSKQYYIPQKNHPFDHYLVISQMVYGSVNSNPNNWT